MPAHKKPIKAKRNNFTLSLEAQAVIDTVPATKKSKVVSAAIINYFTTTQSNNMTTEELIIKVQEWAKDRNIIDGCPPIKQAYKTIEECGKLIEAVATYNLSEPSMRQHYKHYIKDAIGDTAITLIIQCVMQGFDFFECLAAAYDEKKGKVN